MKRKTVEMIEDAALEIISDGWEYIHGTALSDNFVSTSYAAREIADETGDDASVIQDALEARVYSMWQNQ